jgi:hypothetical protein
LLKETNLNEHREALARANADIATVPTHVRVLTISLERSTQNLQLSTSWAGRLPHLLGAKRTCRSTLGQHLELVVPLDRELLQQIIELKGGRLPPFEDGFDDGG